MSFQKQLDEALLMHSRRLRTKCLRESAKPSAGIWYWVWLKPEWVLQTYKDVDFPDVIHVTIWEEFLAGKVAEHYGVSVRQLLPLSYAFPRGRVVHVRPTKKEISLPSDDRGQWTFYHGNDAPGGLERWKKKLVHSFSLNEMVGAIDWKLDDHERRSREEVREIEALIGKIGR